MAPRSLLVAFAGESIGAIAPIMTAVSLSETLTHVTCTPYTLVRDEETYYSFCSAAVAVAMRASVVLKRVSGAELAACIQQTNFELNADGRFVHRFKTPIAVCCGTKGPIDLFAPNMPEEVTELCGKQAKILVEEWEKHAGGTTNRILDAASLVHNAIEKWVSTFPETTLVSVH